MKRRKRRKQPVSCTKPCSGLPCSCWAPAGNSHQAQCLSWLKLFGCVFMSPANKVVCSLTWTWTNNPLLFLYFVPSSKLVATNLLRQVKASSRRKEETGCGLRHRIVPQLTHQWGTSARHHWQETWTAPGSSCCKEHSHVLLVKTP